MAFFLQRPSRETFAHIEIFGAVTNGLEAFAMAAEQSPDIVILDINLPDLMAPEAIRRFR